MTSTQSAARDRVAEDLQHIRQSIDRSGSGTPAPIYALWGLIALIGFSLVDFAPEWVGRFFLVAAPLGFVASVLLGRRAAQQAGQRNERAGRKHMLHWAALLAAIAMTLPMVFAGDIAWPALARLFLIFIALVYFLAGLHLDRRMLLVSGLVAAGYIALLFSPPYGWTWTGAIVALGFWVLAGISWEKSIG